MHKLLTTTKNLCLILHRTSVYSPQYLPPLTDINEIKEAIENPTDVTYRPIKPVQTNLMSFTFSDKLLTTFTNMVMKNSDRVLAYSLVANAFQAIKWKQLREYHTKQIAGDTETYIELNPLVIFHKAIENATPLFLMQHVKRGGTTYQVPCPINPNLSRFRALKWLLEASREKEGPIWFSDKLAWEILDAYKNQGTIIKRKRDLHALCETNKAYAHFRWGS